LGLNIPFLPYAMLSAKAGGNNLKEIKKKKGDISNAVA